MESDTPIKAVRVLRRSMGARETAHHLFYMHAVQYAVRYAVRLG